MRVVKWIKDATSMCIYDTNYNVGKQPCNKYIKFIVICL